MVLVFDDMETAESFKNALIEHTKASPGLAQLQALPPMQEPIISEGTAAAPSASAASAKPKHPARISGGVMAGSILQKAPPTYPANARTAHIYGAVVLHAIIGENGAIQSLSVISGPEMLRASALEAVQNWRYKSYFLNGEPTEVDTTITVNFSSGSDESGG